MTTMTEPTYVRIERSAGIEPEHEETLRQVCESVLQVLTEGTANGAELQKTVQGWTRTEVRSQRGRLAQKVWDSWKDLRGEIALASLHDQPGGWAPGVDQDAEEDSSNYRPLVVTIAALDFLTATMGPDDLVSWELKP